MIAFELLDQMRRWQGDVLDVVGLGPQEDWSRTVVTHPSWALRRINRLASPSGRVC